MVVDDGDSGFAVGMENGGIQLHEGAILPKHAAGRTIDTHLSGDDGQQIVAGLIAEVPRTDLGAHVIAAEGRGGVAPASGEQSHVRDDRQGVPFQPKVGEPRELRMNDVDLQNRIGGKVKKNRLFAGEFNDQRQDIKRSSPRGRSPAESDHALGESSLLGVAEDGAIADAVTGVADKLVVVDADAALSFRCLGEDGDGGSDSPPVGAEAEMVDAGVEDIGGSGRGAGVEKLQSVPKKAADATSVVTPRFFGQNGEVVDGRSQLHLRRSATGKRTFGVAGTHDGTDCAEKDAEVKGRDGWKW